MKVRLTSEDPAARAIRVDDCILLLRHADGLTTPVGYAGCDLELDREPGGGQDEHVTAAGHALTTFVSPNVAGVSKDHNFRVFDEYARRWYERGPEAVPVGVGDDGCLDAPCHDGQRRRFFL